MSRSKLKPEDIFFGLQKTIEAESVEETEKTPIEEDRTVEEKKTEEAMPDEESGGGASAKRGRKKADAKPTKKKRGPAPDPENQRRVSVNVMVSPETKYAMQLLINEMKLRGYVDRYCMTDFVAEAIDEKIKKEKKRFDLA